jgi:hypothetical protein
MFSSNSLPANVLPGSPVTTAKATWSQWWAKSTWWRAIGITILVNGLVGLWMPFALAVTQIQLSEISYRDCPPEIAEGAVTSGGVTQSASCYLVTGKANNPSSKTVYDADVYGRIYDADDNIVLQNRGRLGSIDQVPPGTSDFEMRISIPSNLSTPLQLKKFKASGFTKKIRQ